MEATMPAQLVDLEAVKRAANFERVLAHYGITLTGTGDQRAARCPFHADKKPSLKVHLKRKIFNCFGCKAKGNVLDFVMQQAGLGAPQAAAKIAEICGFALPTKTGADDHPAKRAIRPADARKHLETAEHCSRD